MKEQLEKLVDDFGSDLLVETIAEILLERTKCTTSSSIKERLEQKAYILKDVVTTFETI